MDPKSKTSINNMRDKVKEFGKDAAKSMSWKEAKDQMSFDPPSDEQNAEAELEIAEELFNRFGDPVRLASIAHALQKMAQGEDVTIEGLLEVRDTLLEDLNPEYTVAF